MIMNESQTISPEVIDEIIIHIANFRYSITPYIMENNISTNLDGNDDLSMQMKNLLQIERSLPSCSNKQEFYKLMNQIDNAKKEILEIIQKNNFLKESNKNKDNNI
jgi:hypothetical protein